MRAKDVRGGARTTRRLVLLEPDDSVRDALMALLQSQGWHMELAGNAMELRQVLRSGGAVAVVCEASLPGSDSATILGTCAEDRVPLIFTGHGLPAQAAVDLVRQGAADYLEKPFSHQRLLDLLDHLEQAASRDRNTKAGANLV